jgi:hypothetical protein
VLEAVSGLATLALLALSALVGVRLVRLGNRTAGPERWLGFYFLFYGAIGATLAAVVYSSWSASSFRLPDEVLRAINAVYFVFATAGVGSLFVFTQRTFRPRSRFAAACARTAVGLLVLSAFGVGVSEGFRPRVLNGPAYWTHFGLRVVVFAWVAVESLRYWAAMRRRLALGLADPLLVNRFLLWGVWGVLLAVLCFVDPVARWWYVSLTGTSERWIPEVARPIIQVVVPVASVLTFAAAVALVLTFFPSSGYRRWILSRHAARA